MVNSRAYQMLGNSAVRLWTGGGRGFGVLFWGIRDKIRSNPLSTAQTYGVIIVVGCCWGCTPYVVNQLRMRLGACQCIMCNSS
jgi:hypothetical protein